MTPAPHRFPVGNLTMADRTAGLGGYGLSGADAMGGSSGDYDVFAENGGTADGGSGNDLVAGGNASAMYGSSGGDSVSNYGGDPFIDCGSAHDTVSPGSATTVLHCENDVSNGD